ncbi:MAG: hypothetical protein MUC84_02580 [Solirubrobacteraceae bacterium]|jgi:hypothetical protein|nr:hypothetical protein [Solirubrobacteraceae bacterium]
MLRIPVLAALLLTGALIAAAPAPAAPALAPDGQAAATKKKCKKGFVRKKGRCVCPKGKVKKGSRCVTRRKTPVTPVPGPAPATPAPNAPTTPPAADGPPFSPPGRDLTGTEAANALLKFVANSSFTDCVPGWPNCAVEERYGHFADATMFYCRLTSTSGADIINQGRSFQIIGAEQKADGGWGVTLQVASYDNQAVYYTWSVTTAGVATGLYWGPGKDPRTDQGEGLGPLQWVRGARNCSY